MLHPLIRLMVLHALLFANSANADDVFLTMEKDGKPQPITVQISAGKSEGHVAVYLVNKADGELEVASFSAFLGSDGQVLDGVIVELQTAEGKSFPANAKIKTGSTRVFVRISKLDEFGSFLGEIQLNIKGRPNPTLTTLQVVKTGQPKIEIQQAVGDTISLQAANVNFELPLTLMETKKEVDVTDLHIKLGPLVRQDGASVSGNQRSGEAEQQADSDAEVSIDWSCQDKQSGPLVLQRRAIDTLVLTGRLSEPTEYRSWISLSYAGQLDVYTLVITRPVPSALSVEQAIEKKIKLTVGESDFSRKLSIAAAAGKPPAGELEISLSPITREDGVAVQNEQLTLSREGEKIPSPLPGAPPLDIEIKGSLFESTTYLSMLRLTYQNQTQLIPISITRSAPLANLKIREPGMMNCTCWFWVSPNPIIEVEVDEVANRRTSIYYPRLEQLRAVDAKKNLLGVSAKQIQLMKRLPSGELEEVKDKKESETVVLNRGTTAKYAFRVGGLSSGIYQGQVAALGPSSLKDSKPFTIVVKDDILRAGFVILAGVFLSLWFHYYLRIGKDRDKRNANIALAREAVLVESAAAPADPIWRGLLARLEILHQKNMAGQETNDTMAAELDDIANRRRSYRDAIAWRNQGSELLASFPREPDEVDEKRKQLSQRLNQLFKRFQTTLDREKDTPNFPQAKKILEELQNKVNEIRYASIRAPAENIIHELNLLITKTAPFKDSSTEKARQILEKVSPILKELEQAPQDNNVANWAETIQNARADYADLRVDQLQGMIEVLRNERLAAELSDSKVEACLIAADDHLRSARREEITIDERLSRWNDANQQFLGALIGNLQQLVSDDRCPPDIDTTVWKTSEVIWHLDQANTAWTKSQFTTAEKSYQDACDEYLKIQVKILRQRVTARGKLIRERLVIVPEDQWEMMLESEPLSPKLAALDGVIGKLPAAGEVDPAVRRARYMEARVVFARTLSDSLESVVVSQQEYYEQHKDEDHQGDADQWSRIQSEDFPKLIETVVNARIAMEQYDKSPTADALANAEKEIRGACNEHRQFLLKVESKTVPKTSPSAELLAIDKATVNGSAEVLSGALRAMNLSLRAPDQTLLGTPIFGKYELQSSAEYFRRLKFYNLLVNLVVLFVGTALGVSLLWATNPTFGGIDYLPAFIWGFVSNEAGKSFLGLATGAGALPPKA